MRCVELLDGQTKLPESTATLIWNFLIPILPQSKTAEKEADKLVRKLCDDAFNLAILMRKSKDKYIVEAPKENTLMTSFEGAEPQDTERGGSALSCQSPVIAFCLFGALIKRPERNPDERMVLEPSHVVQFK
jgi:hypothetical protein